MGKWKQIIVLFLILAGLVWAYTHFNGGSSSENFLKVFKTDGLKALIIVVCVSIGVLFFKNVFKAKIHK